MTTTLAPNLFDYAALPTADRAAVERVTTEIRDRMGRAAQNIVEIGARLIDVKARLPHGSFGAWLSAEFDWSDWTARKMMEVAAKFKTVNFTDLTVAPSALYLLASDSTPAEVRDAFVEKAKAGEPVTHSDVKAAVQQAKPVHADPETRQWLDDTDPLLAQHMEKLPPEKLEAVREWAHERFGKAKAYSLKLPQLASLRARLDEAKEAVAA